MFEVDISKYYRKKPIKEFNLNQTMYSLIKNESIGKENSPEKVLQKEYYDVQGIHNLQPGKGIYIRREVYNNGQSKSRKQVYK